MHLLIFKDSTFAQMRDWTRFKELKTLAVKPALGFDTPERIQKKASVVCSPVIMALVVPVVSTAQSQKG